ncbi:type 2 periplasmic-binding domain-containing protein [Paenibacillus swuensis]|nr:hypothetical protein [Paenibacillus swuensis]
MRKREWIFQVKFVGMLVLIVCGIWFAFKLVLPLYEYNIPNNRVDIQFGIEEFVGSPVSIHGIKDIVDKKLVLYVVNKTGQVGDAELSQGPFGKLKFERKGLGSMNIRSRVMETEEGQYLWIAGRNLVGIARAEASFYDADSLSLAVPTGNMFMVSAKLASRTQNSFAGEIKYFDRRGREIPPKQYMD